MRTSSFPACSIAPQPSTILRAPAMCNTFYFNIFRRPNTVLHFRIIDYVALTPPPQLLLATSCIHYVGITERRKLKRRCQITGERLEWCPMARCPQRCSLHPANCSNPERDAYTCDMPGFWVWWKSGWIRKAKSMSPYWIRESLRNGSEQFYFRDIVSCSYLKMSCR
jgi:hypothetical protein